MNFSGQHFEFTRNAKILPCKSKNIQRKVLYDVLIKEGREVFFMERTFKTLKEAIELAEDIEWLKHKRTLEYENLT